MKNTRVLIDTNILLDYLQKRAPFYCAAEKIMDLCVDNRLDGYIAAHTVTNLFYILRKNFTIDERKEMLLSFCEIFTVIDINNEKLVSALKNKQFNDFEDCLQFECALQAKVDYIISRNPQDFAGSKIPVVDSDGFVRL